MIKKINVFVCAVVLMLSLTACYAPKEVTFDAQGYVKSLIDSTYKNANDDYISFSGATTAIAEDNNIICAENASVRFFEFYEINPSEEQQATMVEVFKKAYSAVSYTVGEMKEIAGGYEIEISYYPIGNFEFIASQIDDLKLNSGLERYDVGATFIDNIITLCDESLNEPMHNEQKNTIVDIKVTEDKEYYLNLDLLQTIDIEIMPL